LKQESRHRATASRNTAATTHEPQVFPEITVKRNPSGIWPRARYVASLLLLIGAAVFAQALPQIIQAPNPPNAAAQQDKPYVVLVSLDGFRYDYVKKYSAPNIVALAKRGATAPDGMIPSYPSLTFPNHYAIISGLYPEHSGIVSNRFYDPERREHYVFTDRKSSDDGTWYGGVPLWSLAEQNEMRAACFFWPATGAEIAGKRPSYYLEYDASIPNDARVAQVLAWLRLPPAERPHFITLYMSDVDHAGHDHGPDSPEVAEAVKTVDAEIGKLASGIDALHMRIDLIVLADHGMAKVDGGWINLDQWADLSNFIADGSLLYPKTDADAEKAFESLKSASSKFHAYRRADVPAALHYNSNPREGDPVIVLTGPYLIRAHAPILPSGQTERPPMAGEHGYDPLGMPEMKAFFLAAGPDIRNGATLQSFENVDLYPLIAQILGLPVGKIDGDAKPLQSILKNQKPN